MMVVVGEERKGRRGTGNVRVLCMLCMVCGEQEGWLIENEPRRHCSAACPSHYTTTPHHTTPPYHPPPSYRCSPARGEARDDRLGDRDVGEQHELLDHRVGVAQLGV